MTPEELSDRMEIVDVCTRLHWYVDHREWDHLDGVLAERVSFPTPAESEVDGFEASAYIRTREDIKAAYPVLLAGLVTQHLIAGHQVDLDGDQGVCRAHSINIHVPEDGPPNTIVAHGNEYRFELERTAEGWRICGRRTWIRWRSGDEAWHDVDGKMETWARSVGRGG